METKRNFLYRMLKSTGLKTSRDESISDSPGIKKQPQRSELTNRLHSERNNERKINRDKLISQTRGVTPQLNSATIKSAIKSINPIAKKVPQTPTPTTTNNLAIKQPPKEYDFKTSALSLFKTKPMGQKATTTTVTSKHAAKVESKHSSADTSLLSTTYTLDAQMGSSSDLSQMGTQSSNNRKKLLDEWRTKKKETDKSKPPKPAFKAGASSTTTTPAIETKQTSKMPILPKSSTFNFTLKMSKSTSQDSLANNKKSANTSHSITSSSSIPNKQPIRSNSVRIQQSKETPKVQPITSRFTKATPNVQTSTTKQELKTSISKASIRKEPSIKKPTSTKPLDVETLTSKLNNISVSIEPAKPAKLDIQIQSKSRPERKSTETKQIELNSQPIGGLNETRIDSVQPRLTSSPIKRPILEPEPEPEPKPVQPEITINAEYFEKVDLDKRDIKYYRLLVDFNTSNLNRLSNEWISLCQAGQIPDDVQGEIRSACGLAKLLIDERFTQFSDLIVQCEQTNNPNNQSCLLVVKCTDLQGFWDMVDAQVIDVIKKFEILEKIKQNNYVITPDLIPIPQCQQPAPNRPAFKPNKHYLKKKDQKTDGEKQVVEQNETKPLAESKPAVNKLAEFKARMKAMKSQTKDIEIQIAEPKQLTPKPLKENAVLKESQDSARRSSRRKSKIVQIDLNQEATKKYNLRSRPSDLIKFDSPVMSCNLDTVAEDSTVQVNSIQSPFSLRKSRKKSIYPEKIKEDEVLEDKENDDDFLKFDDTLPFKWNSRPSIMPESTLTPNKGTTRESVAFPANSRESILEVPKFTNIANSPLLKIALISSQSKRLSINSLSRYFE